MSQLHTTEVAAPWGQLWLAADPDGQLLRLTFDGDAARAELGANAQLIRGGAGVRTPAEQLGEYLAGSRRGFDLRLAPRGTPFQRAVWDVLLAIPYGETRSYGDVARSLGRPGAARAVGRANHANPIAIVIPCHRVVGADGSLTGFGGGLDTKHWLLEHERRHADTGAARQRQLPLPAASWETDP